jgi:hypothetical protein
MRQSAISTGVNFLTVGWLMEAEDDAGAATLAVGTVVPVDQGGLETTRLDGWDDGAGVACCS